MITHDTSLHRLTLPWLVSGLRVQPRGVRAAGPAGGGRHAHRHTGAAQPAQVHRPGQVDCALCVCNVSYRVDALCTLYLMFGQCQGLCLGLELWWLPGSQHHGGPSLQQVPLKLSIYITDRSCCLVFCSTSLVPSLNCAHVQAGAVRAGRGARDGLAALRHRIHREIHVRTHTLTLWLVTFEESTVYYSPGVCPGTATTGVATPRPAWSTAPRT